MQNPEPKQRWSLANIEKKREQARAYVKRQIEKDSKAYRIKANEISKRSRLKNIDKVRESNRLALQKRRASDVEGYNLKQREYRRNNKEKFRQYYEKYRETARAQARKRLLKKYNLTPDTYDLMLLKQEGKCAICTDPFGNIQPHIDHSHETGLVRSLLCSSCNIVLGHVEKIQKKLPNILKGFTEYLEIHSNQM